MRIYKKYKSEFSRRMYTLKMQIEANRRNLEKVDIEAVAGWNEDTRKINRDPYEDVVIQVEKNKQYGEASSRMVSNKLVRI